LDNVWVNPTEDINHNGIADFYSSELGGDLDTVDNDGNGKKDDLIGWDFYYMDNYPEDIFNHGTKSAGITSARTHNVIGIAGIVGGWGNAKGARFMVLKATQNNGRGYHSLLAAGVEYAARKGAKVLNTSLGLPEDSTVLKEAVLFAVNDCGVVISATAGNQPEKERILYPARYSEVIAVSATDNLDRSIYGNYPGSALDLAAPSGVITTDNADYYEMNYSGTSAATPHVAGLCGLILSLENYEPNLVQEILQKTALDLGDYGWDQEFGWGRIRADKALQSVQNRPRNLTVSAFNQHPRLIWNAVQNATYYVIYKAIVSNMNINYFILEEVTAQNTSYIDYSETINQQQPLDKIVAYRVTAVVYSEETAKSNKAQIAVNGQGGALPKKTNNLYYELYQNHPNPFNPTTKIKYAVGSKQNAESGEQFVTLKVFDLLGREVAVLVNKPKQTGEYEVEFNAEKYGLSSGVYLYRLTAGSFSSTKKFVYLR